MAKTGKARQGMPVPFAVALGVAESYASAVAIATGLTRGPLKRPAERFVHALQESLSRAVLFKDVKQRAWLETRDRWGRQAVLQMDTPLGLDNMEVGARE